MPDAEIIKSRLKKAVHKAQETVGGLSGGTFVCVIYEKEKKTAGGVSRPGLQEVPTAPTEAEAIRAALAVLISWRPEVWEIHAGRKPLTIVAAAICSVGTEAFRFAAPLPVAARYGFGDSFTESQTPINPARCTVAFIQSQTEDNWESLSISGERYN